LGIVGRGRASSLPSSSIPGTSRRHRRGVKPDQPATNTINLSRSHCLPIHRRRSRAGPAPVQTPNLHSNAGASATMTAEMENKIPTQGCCRRSNALSRKTRHPNLSTAAKKSTTTGRNLEHTCNTLLHPKVNLCPSRLNRFVVLSQSNLDYNNK
jgi:hypothetical protein